MVAQNCSGKGFLPAGAKISQKSCSLAEEYGIIKTDEPRTLDFSWVRGFLVTNVYIVQRSAA